MLVWSLLLAACGQDPVVSYPVAGERASETINHGRIRQDNFSWLSHTDDLDVADYVNAERAYFERSIQHLAALRATLANEMNARLATSQRSTPIRIGDAFYYREINEGTQYPIFLRTGTEIISNPQVVLDLNERGQGHEYYALGSFAISPDGQYVAFTEDFLGGGNYQLVVRDINKNDLISTGIRHVSNSIAWSADSQNIYYVGRAEGTGRPFQLKTLQLGKHAADANILFTETDQHFHLAVDQAKNGHGAILRSLSSDTSEIHLIIDDGILQLVAPRSPGHRYSIRGVAGQLIMLTNFQSGGFGLATATIGSTDPENWRMLVSAKPDLVIEDFEVFDQHLVLVELLTAPKKMAYQIRIIDRTTGNEDFIRPLEPTAKLRLHTNPDPASPELRYWVKSMTSPESLLSYHFEDHNTHALASPLMIGDYDKKKYVEQRLWFAARDGVQVPISIVYQASIQLGDNPGYLSAYGAYGQTQDLGFNEKRLSLLDRGFLIAQIHVRGGGDLGSSWHAAGSLLNKRNSFNDFIDGTRFLIEQGWVNKDQIFASGRSAGGTIMTVVANEAPELYRGIIAHVPFVDLITTLGDGNNPLTIGDRLEWGDPAEKVAYDYLLSYSPYDQIKQQRYPPMLITTAINDSRVHYSEALKWIAKLRRDSLNPERHLIDILENTGHLGPSDQYERRQGDALEFAFILDELDRTPAR